MTTPILGNADQLARALTDRAASLTTPAPRLFDDPDGLYVAGLATTATTTWTATTWTDISTAIPERGPGRVAATRAVIETAWQYAHRAGAHAGHRLVADYIAVSALDAAPPARLDMSDRTRDLANQLHAARVATTALRRYLTDHGARRVGDWRGGDLYHMHTAVGRFEVLVPHPERLDHPLRILDAATLIAAGDDRSIAAVLADLATPPPRPPSTYDALRFLWQVYQTASQIGSFPSEYRDPGPANHNFPATLIHIADDNDLDRLVTATLIGHHYGIDWGLADGAASASTTIRAQLRGHRDGRDDTIRIGASQAVDWLQAVDGDARAAADTVRARHTYDGLAGHLTPGSFAPLAVIDPTHRGEPTQPPASRPGPAAHR